MSGKYLHVETTVEVHGQLKVIAVAFVLSVPLSPEVADRRALKAGIYQKSNTV